MDFFDVNALIIGGSHGRSSCKKTSRPGRCRRQTADGDNRRKKTIREFKAQNVDDQTLSEILWVAFGISHDGKRTIPTAMNQQNLKVYVVRNDGAWLYDAAENSLTQVTAENLQPLFATQDFMKDVPVNLVYVGSDEKYSPMHAGSAYQNVGLYAASKGMHSVVRGYFDNDRVTKALNLENGERAIVSQAIGW